MRLKRNWELHSVDKRDHLWSIFDPLKSRKSLDEIIDFDGLYL